VQIVRDSLVIYDEARFKLFERTFLFPELLLAALLLQEGVSRGRRRRASRAVVGVAPLATRARLAARRRAWSVSVRARAIVRLVRSFVRRARSFAP